MSSWLRDAGQAKLLEVDMDLTRTRVTFLYIPFNSIQFFFFQSTSSKHNSRYLLSFCQYILQRDSYGSVIALFTWFISRTFLANEQYFSLTTNQPTVLSVMTYLAYQPNKQGNEEL